MGLTASLEEKRKKKIPKGLTGVTLYSSALRLRGGDVENGQWRPRNGLPRSASFLSRRHSRHCRPRAAPHARKTPRPSTCACAGCRGDQRERWRGSLSLLRAADGGGGRPAGATGRWRPAAAAARRAATTVPPSTAQSSRVDRRPGAQPPSGGRRGRWRPPPPRGGGGAAPAAATTRRGSGPAARVRGRGGGGVAVCNSRRAAPPASCGAGAGRGGGGRSSSRRSPSHSTTRPRGRRRGARRNSAPSLGDPAADLVRRMAWRVVPFPAMVGRGGRPPCGGRDAAGRPLPCCG